MKLSSITTTLGLGLVLFGPLRVLGASEQGNPLRVSVFNSSPISPSTIERAEGEAGRVLRDAGVEVIWLNCPLDAQHEASLGRCSVGISFSAEDGQGCYADLFYVPIQQLQEETHATPSVILGHAMAHELGHLLLGTNSHSASGLMRAHWTREDLTNASRGNLRFSLEQSLRIMNRLNTRESRETQAVAIDAVIAGTERLK